VDLQKSQICIVQTFHAMFIHINRAGGSYGARPQLVKTHGHASVDISRAELMLHNS